jgi:site-specific DNA-adenine methylase
LAKKLTEYCLILKQMDIKFSSMCFDNFMNTKTQLKPEETFVFIDPPYLLSDDSYSRTSSIKWTQEMEDRLFILMDNLIKNKYRFILTNFIELKGKKHKQLEEFISSNSLRIVELNSDYKRCNYQKDKSQRSVEVIVLNT